MPSGMERFSTISTKICQPFSSLAVFTVDEASRPVMLCSSFLVLIIISLKLMGMFLSGSFAPRGPFFKPFNLFESLEEFAFPPGVLLFRYGAKLKLELKLHQLALNLRAIEHL